MIVADLILEILPAALAAAAVLALQVSAAVVSPKRERTHTAVLDVPLGTDSASADSDLLDRLMR
jgi:hypothetical protein